MSKNNTLADYMIRRKIPGNCIRCARLNDDTTRKTCSSCREKLKNYREERFQTTLSRARKIDISTILRKIEILEMQVENLQNRINKDRTKTYQLGRTQGIKTIRTKAQKAISSPRYRSLEDSLYGSDFVGIDYDELKRHGIIAGGK